MMLEPCNYIYFFLVGWEGWQGVYSLRVVLINLGLLWKEKKKGGPWMENKRGVQLGALSSKNSEKSSKVIKLINTHMFLVPFLPPIFKQMEGRNGTFSMPLVPSSLEETLKLWRCKNE